MVVSIFHINPSVTGTLTMDCIPVLEGKVALVSYITSISSLLALHASSYSPWVAALFLLPLLGLLPLPRLRQIAMIAAISCGLGLLFSAGLLLLTCSETLPFLGAYLMALSFFHFSEYLLTAAYNHTTLTIHSFLLDHSPEYAVAALASWLEFAAEYWLFPGFKTAHPYFSLVGALLVGGGELLRKLAMTQAKSNFTHTVMFRKRASHRLVTGGVYGWVRHPSYVGWFYWSLGTQVLLCNPLCLVAYTLASWKFFAERTYNEERYLIEFFKQEYVDYKKRVWSGLPFIRGFPLEEVGNAFPASDLDVASVGGK